MKINLVWFVQKKSHNFAHTTSTVTVWPNNAKKWRKRERRNRLLQRLQRARLSGNGPRCQVTQTIERKHVKTRLTVYTKTCVINLLRCSTNAIRKVTSLTLFIRPNKWSRCKKRLINLLKRNGLQE